jgi:pyridoxamine 5'-phosphate oxidase
MNDLEPQEQPNPFIVFTNWLHDYATRSKSNYTGACVLSTVGMDGYPNARNVSLKLLEYPFLIFGTPMNSRKSMELKASGKVALTFWWEESMRQIRIQGIASELDLETADFLFDKRNKESQVVSLISAQGSDLPSWEIFEGRYRITFEEWKDQKIERPEHWGGFKVEPIRYEFMEFRETRLHHRSVFEKKKDRWEMKMIQP